MRPQKLVDGRWRLDGRPTGHAETAAQIGGIGGGYRRHPVEPFAIKRPGVQIGKRCFSEGPILVAG